MKIILTPKNLNAKWYDTGKKVKAWNVYIKSKCIQKYTYKITADKAKGE